MSQNCTNVPTTSIDHITRGLLQRLSQKDHTVSLMDLITITVPIPTERTISQKINASTALKQLLIGYTIWIQHLIM